MRRMPDVIVSFIAGCGVGFGIGILTPGFAQDQSSRQIRALPVLIDQRNNALDSLALCFGDLAEAQRQLAEARKQIEELKAKAEPK